MIIRVAIISILVLYRTYLVSAQVSQLGLGFGGSLMDYEIDGTDRTWVGVDVSGLYMSDDRGNHWIRMNNQPVSDHISEIFVHPDDQDLILLGTRGSLLRSTDRGNSWRDIREGLPEHRSAGNPSLAIVDIIVDPHNADVLYAAQGDRREASKESWSSGETKYGKGTIYKSMDRGETWSNLRDSYGNVIDRSANIFALALATQVKDVVFAATSRGLYKSTNGGVNFKKVHGIPHDRITSVAIAPDNNNQMYITMDYEDAEGYGVYRSKDFGRSWEAANNGIPQSHEGKLIRPYHLIVDWKNNNVVYMASTESGSIWKTTNAGSTWTNAYTFKVQNHGWSSYGSKYLKAYGFAQSPIDRNYLIAGEHWSHKTEDAAGSWYQVYSTEESPYGNNGADFTVSDIVIPSPTVQGLVLMGQYDNGLYLSTDHGATWENKHSEMRKDEVSNWLVAVTDIAYAANGDIYAAVELSYYQPNGGFVIKKSTNNGATWSVVLDAKLGSEYHSYGIYHGLETHPTDPNKVFVTSFDPKQHMTIRTLDGGQTWEKIGNEPPHRLIRQLLIDPSAPDTMYAVAGYHNDNLGRIYKSLDGGESWVTINETTLSDPRNLAIDPEDNNILYLAQTPHDGQGGIYKSTDGGVTWAASVTATAGTKSEWLHRRIDVNGGFFGATSVAVHPDHSEIVLATFGAATGQFFGDYRPGYGLAISEDAGASWRMLGLGQIKFGRLYNIQFDPFDHNYIYTGSGGSGGFRINVAKLMSEDNSLGLFIQKLKSRPEDISMEDFESIGISDLNQERLADYVAALQDETEELYHVGQVEQIISSVENSERTLLEQIQELLGADQAHMISINMLENLGLADLYSELLFEYHELLSGLDETADFEEIQAAIDQANKSGSLALIEISLERRDTTFSNQFFELTGATNLKADLFTAYKEALLVEGFEFSEEAFLSLITLTNEANAVTNTEAIRTNMVRLYPNPVHDQLIMSFGHTASEFAHFDIMDLSGKVLKSGTLTVHKTSILNVDHLSSGLYLIRVDVEGLCFQKRFIKK